MTHDLLALFSLLADVLVPQVRVFGDEGGHEFHARGIVQNFDNDTLILEKVLGTLERAILPDHHPRYSVEQHGTRAHRARRQRRVEDRLSVVGCR